MSIPNDSLEQPHGPAVLDIVERRAGQPMPQLKLEHRPVRGPSARHGTSAANPGQNRDLPVAVPVAVACRDAIPGEVNAAARLAGPTRTALTRSGPVRLSAAQEKPGKDG